MGLWTIAIRSALLYVNVEIGASAAEPEVRIRVCGKDVRTSESGH